MDALPTVLERLKVLYPQVNCSETPLTTSWNPREKYNYLGLSNNNLRVHYKGGPGKSLKDAASVRGMHPIPASCGVYYFEIKVISKGKNGYVGVGVSDRTAPLSRLPGWEKCSYGYHADDGKAFASSAAGEDYGPTYTTDDVIGCGVNLLERSIFYTKNGIHLGTAFRDIPPQMSLYPTVGLQTHGEVVEANFGGHPFVFDFKGLLSEMQSQVVKAIKCYPLGDSEAKCQTQIHKFVLDYLTVHGYSATAESFANSTKQPLAEQVDSIRNRQNILSLVLCGRVGEAIGLTQKLYPGVLEDRPELLFRLKCQQFVEMILGHDVVGCRKPSGQHLPGSPSPSPPQDNGCLSNGVNGGHNYNMDTVPPLATELPGLPCGGNRVAIERLLHFGQDLQQMLHFMGPLPSKAELQERMHDIFSLIAYSDIKACPISHLADPSRREPICETLNAAISSSLHLPVCSPFEVSLGHAHHCLKLMAVNGLGASGLVSVCNLLDHPQLS